MTSMTRQSTVYVISQLTETFAPGCLVFRPDGYDDPAENVPRYRRFDLERDVWEDMGRPTKITVTVVPGDALNEGVINDD